MDPRTTRFLQRDVHGGVFYHARVGAFRAKLVPIKSGGQYVVVTPAVVAAAGLAVRDRVRGTVDGVAYRSSLSKYSGKFHVGVQSAVLRAAGVASATRSR
jgi:hypothetical protein